MRKIIKKWGNAAGVLFSAEDLELYGLKIGDVIDLTDMHKINPKDKVHHYDITDKGIEKAKREREKKKAKKKEDLNDVLKRMPQ